MIFDGEQSGTDIMAFTVENFPESLGAVESMALDHKMEAYELLHLLWRKILDNTIWLVQLDFFLEYARNILEMYPVELSPVMTILAAAFASEFMENEGTIICNPDPIMPDDDFDLWLSESLRRDVAASILLYGYDCDAATAAVINGKRFETGYVLSDMQNSIVADNIEFYFDEQSREELWKEARKNEVPF